MCRIQLQPEKGTSHAYFLISKGADPTLKFGSNLEHWATEKLVHLAARIIKFIESGHI